jgi:hypothetical protein
MNLIQAPTFSLRHNKIHSGNNRHHSERDCHRSITTQPWNADMPASSNHIEVSVHCCHSKHTVPSSRPLLLDLVEPRFLDLSTSWRWVVSFTPRPLYPRYPLDKRFVDPRASLYDMEKWKFDLTGTRTPTPPVVQPIASRYTDWAMLALPYILYFQKCNFVTL